MAIQLKDEHAKHLLQYYKSRIEEIDATVTSLHGEKGELIDLQKDLIGKLKSGGNSLANQQLFPPTKNLNGFPKGGSWAERAIYVINEAGQSLSSFDILKAISTHDWSIKAEQGKVMNSLSSILNTYSKKGTFTKTKNADKKWVYGVGEK